ncbi:hypothetical protein PROFUN_16841 [Planoprotostelium fungivorum]|uniref:Uncharacterized protein n=1 Tax=Planoprotostelium fungivorum TaxID=1890364 RepID=A0A2P6MNK4_9EUKA|nr:hypothetical protein PROFUN_16841 [Planoprotostelium fungivorum]
MSGKTTTTTTTFKPATPLTSGLQPGPGSGWGTGSRSICGFNESLFIKNDFKPKKAKDLRDKFTPLQFDALHHVSCLSCSVSLDNYPLFVGRDAARHQQDTLPRGKQKGRNLVLQFSLTFLRVFQLVNDVKCWAQHYQCWWSWLQWPIIKLHSNYNCCHYIML